MIKVEIQCHSCDVAISEEINYREGIPYWGWRLWKSSLAAGWARRLDDHAPFCANCKSQLESPSTMVLPIEPLPIIGYVQCNMCSNRLEKGFVSLDEHFIRKLRENARSNGWRFITIDGSQSYRDYCKRCEPDELGERRLALMELVWSIPTVKVADEMGISDKAVEKRCKRLGVPKPPVGFWAKYHAGYIRDCRSMIPEIVSDSLGIEFVDAFYSVDQDGEDSFVGINER